MKNIIFPLRHMLIVGNEKCGKTKFIKDVIPLFRDEGYDIDILSESIDYTDIGFNTTNTLQAVEKLTKYQVDMMNIYKEMELHQVNNYEELPNPPSKKVIIIDNIYSYMWDFNFRYVNSIKQSILELVRLGRAAGMFIIITTKTAGGSVILTEISNNISTRILLGDYDKQQLPLIFDDDYKKVETIEFSADQGIIKKEIDGKTEIKTFKF